MAQTIIQKITGKAEKLRMLRDYITDEEQKFKIRMEDVKKDRDSIQDELLIDMRKHKLSSIKVESGETFTKAVRKGVDITSESLALKWAIDHRAVSINKIVAGQLLKEAKEIPQGFQLVETEYISVRKPKPKDNGTDTGGDK